MPAPKLIASTDNELRSRTSIKWSRVQPGDIAADVAELDFRVAAPILATLRRSIAHSDLGYPDFSAGTPVRLAEIFSERMERRFGWSPSVGRVEICAQIMQALCCAVLAYTSPGDGVLTHAPTYMPITQMIERLDRRCVTLPVQNLSDLSELHERIAAIYPGIPVRLVVLCHPHNPTGHVFDQSTLEVIGQFADRQNAVVFSDEIYQDLVYDSGQYRSAGAIDGLCDRALVFTSAAKSFNVAGLRCAVGHFGNNDLHETYCRLPWHLRDGSSLLGISATIVAWSNADAWLRELMAQLAQNRHVLIESLGDAPGIRWNPPSATYLAWLDVRGSIAEAEPWDFLHRTAGVTLQAGAAYGAGFDGFVRLNFGTSEARLRDILGRIIGALSAHS